MALNCLSVDHLAFTIHLEETDESHGPEKNQMLLRIVETSSRKSSFQNNRGKLVL